MIITIDNVTDVPDAPDNEISIWINSPYLGEIHQKLLSNLYRKLRKVSKPNINVKFKTIYNSNKVCFYTNMKDRTPIENQSFVVYEFTCPGCSDKYIGKTERNLSERCVEHATIVNSAINSHITSCENFRFLFNMLRLGCNDDNNTRDYLINSVKDNTFIIDRSPKWNTLLLKEAIHIKRRNPHLNSGLKASKELYLFA